MSQLTLQVCPVCGVKIEGGDKVLFSAGPTGSRARLWARVCNYVQKPDCINKVQEKIGEISENDYYKPL
jgi:hypothetical protein